MRTPLRLLFGRARSVLAYVPGLQLYVRRRFLRANFAAVRVADDVILCRVLGQFKLYVSTGDVDIGPHLALDGHWEPRVTEVIVDRLRAGDTAIDVGANVGYFTLLMAGLVEREGRVLSFEPHPVTAGLLARTLRTNGLESRVAAHMLPLAATDGEAVAMIVPQGMPGGAHLVAADHPGALALAATRRLDGIPGAMDAVLVKLDAEGAEERIWQGMSGLLAGTRLRWVVIEFSRPSYRDAPGLLAEAAAHGFRFRRIEGDRRLARVTAAEILAGAPQQMLLFER